MGRGKHRDADHFLANLKNAEKYAAQAELERRQRAAWESLSRKEQIAAHNANNALHSPMHEAIAATTVCQLPMCDRPPITMAGESLGVCYNHAVNIATWWDIQGEDFRTQLARVDRIEKAAARDRIEQQRAELRANSPGWIYYVHVGDIIKIGFTRDVRQRMRNYPPMSPLLAMHPGTLTLEKELHQQFAGSRSHGREWFLDTPELRDHIKVVIEQFGEPDRARYEWRDQHKQRNLKAG